MAYQSESARVLQRLREMYNEDPQKSLDAARTFVKLRNSPSSNFYTPYASEKSNYKELTDFFGVNRFDDDFFRQGSVLAKHLRYDASGTPLAPTKKAAHMRWLPTIVHGGRQTVSKCPLRKAKAGDFQ